MKPHFWIAALALVLAPFASSASAKDGEPKQLFRDETPIQITIDGPLKKIASKAKYSTDEYPGTLTVDGKTIPIQLQARGLSRRTGYGCQFPPLRVIFPTKPADGLFKGQEKLKLVVHCRNQDKYEQYELREYEVYKLYNILTPKSFKVRLARVNYRNDGKDWTQRWGFFIEDTDDMAHRIGGKEVHVQRINASLLDPEDAARTALFQYMVANFDWEFLAGPKGTDCCHNAKLVSANGEALAPITPVPYDFDYTGFVDPPYAVIPPSWNVSSTRDRYYWGMCMHNAEVHRLASEFLAARPAMEAQINGNSALEQGTKDTILKFLDGFWEDISSDEEIDKRVLRTCRG